MIKCHCAEVFFEEVLSAVKGSNRPILEIAQEMGAATTCTACTGDLLNYVSKRLEESVFA